MKELFRYLVAAVLERAVVASHGGFSFGTGVANEWVMTPMGVDARGSFK